MADISDAEWAAAEERGNIELAIKPRALSARYDAVSGRLVIDLVNGSVFAFPPRLAEGLEHATEEQLAKVEILGSGFGLHWEELDVDLKVESVLAGRFGSKKYMTERFGSAWRFADAA
ncbi:MAG: DUF2442 domain-containing protein [Sphingomonas sp.]